ncbi:MAG TPA: hypothetical protein VF074_14975, partial [Pyrinomonadaceae bacterium]
KRIGHQTTHGPTLVECSARRRQAKAYRTLVQIPLTAVSGWFTSFLQPTGPRSLRARESMLCFISQVHFASA